MGFESASSAVCQRTRGTRPAAEIAYGMAVLCLPGFLTARLCSGGRSGPDSSAAPCGLAWASTCKSKRELGWEQEMRLQWGAVALLTGAARVYCSEDIKCVPNNLSKQLW